MASKRAVLLAVTAVGAILAAEPLNNDVPTLYHASTRLVLVPVTVTDRYARTVEGLRAEDFVVFDNKVRQQITSFGVEEAPCSITIILDTSGSMNASLATEKMISEDIVRTANPRDEFQLLTFATEPEGWPGFSPDTEAIERMIRDARSGGMTSLLDTVRLGMKRMKEARRSRRAMLILSDGLDNYSRYPETEVMDLALEEDVQIYTMIFDSGLASDSSVPFRPPLAGKSWQPSGGRDGSGLLERFAARTGGLSFHIHGADDARKAASQAEQALRNQYVIGYQPSIHGEPGSWHHISVTADIPKLNVHARNGYFVQ